jgi:hypothetical protein
VHENFSPSNSREEEFHGMIDGCTNHCMDSDPLNPEAYASDLTNLQEETIVENDLSPFLQEVSYSLLVPEIEEEDQEIDHLVMQEKGILDSPIFDEYSDEGE